MLMGLAVAAFLLLWWLLHRYWGEGRFAFLLACIAWGTLAVFIAEILSVATLLSRWPLAIAWGVVLAIELALVRRLGGGRAVLADVKGLREPPLLVRIVIGIALALLVIAIAAPPNTWDSLTYHMPRVAHWVQNASLGYYATNNGRQVHLSPGAEFLILHFQLLSGSDRFANCVQWAAMVGSAVGVSWIARALGAGAKGQQLAAVLCATIPMGIFQATSTQNDYAGAFWMVCFIAMAMELAGWPASQPPPADAEDREPRPRGKQMMLILAMGASLGLAVLTKATVYIMLPPFMLWLFLAASMTFRQRFATACLALAMAGLVNLGFFVRNAHASGKILGPGVEYVDGVIHTYNNDQIDLRTVASNVVRNLAIQIPLPSVDWNVAMSKLVFAIHRGLGIGASDPRTTLTNQRFIMISMATEDAAQGLATMVLTVASLATLRRVARPNRWRILAYFACVIVAFLLFCAYLKWQPWHTRLHLPLLVLLSAGIAAVIDQAWPRALRTPVALLVLITSIPYLLFNPTRPLLGAANVLNVPRSTQYFVKAPYLQQIYQRNAERIAERGCARVALASTHDDPEYFLWVTLKPRMPQAHIRHVRVGNYSQAFEFREKTGPDCAVVVIESKAMNVKLFFGEGRP